MIVVQIVLDAVDSEHTRRAYGRALNDFMAWYDKLAREAADSGALPEAN